MGEEAVEVVNELYLPRGGIIQFGNGDQYQYEGPQVGDDFVLRVCPRLTVDTVPVQATSLYSEEFHLYGGDNANSSVLRVHRLCDGRPFVAKVILHPQRQMARTEIAIYNALGNHPRIVQFKEAFYDVKLGIHRESGC